MVLPDFLLHGKVAIVTGAGRGIGKSIALALARAGADVALCSRTFAEVAKTADEISKVGRRALPVVADVTVKSEVDNFVEQTLEEFGAVDILVNNAGTVLYAPLSETTIGDWDKVVDTNLRSYYICSQAVGKTMVAQGRGNIINVASALAFKVIPNRGVYSVTKAGIVHLTHILAFELGPYNVRVNCIAPGLIRTSAVTSQTEHPEIVQKIESETPLRRIGEPGDCVGAVVFLASDASSFITGQTIFIDGGRHVT